ncbi:hypothetical protein [Lactobacillus hominis]|uniref:hypothetical protein n=1 Tax=Lactobacillus hominis TaxID=1203033 RepID=UPI00260C51AD|nr:hypothetical protein [Lactobacillus hominis]
MDKKSQFLDKYFLEVNLRGTKFIDMNEFYAQLNEYQGYSDEQKKQVKLFLYSAYYVDKYRFASAKNWKKIKITNKNTNQDTYFDLEKYLTQKEIFSIRPKETDYNISINANGKKLNVCYSPELNKINLHIIGEKLYDAYSLLDLILSDLEVKDDEVQKWSTIIDPSDNDFSQKIDVNSFYEDIKIGYTKVVKAQYPNIDRDKVNCILEQYKEGLDTVIFNFEVLSHLNIKQNNQIEIPDLHIWDVLMKNSYTSYLSTSFPVELETKYIGQAFGKNGNRNIYDRIGNGHEHIQKLLATCPDSKELALNFFSLHPKSEMLGQAKDPKLLEFLKAINENKHDDITPSQYVNLTELGLITYFKPSANIELKNRTFSSPNDDLKTINEINSKYSGIIISMDLKDNNIKIFSEQRPLSEAFIPTKSRIQYKFDSNLSSLIPLIKQYREI